MQEWTGQNTAQFTVMSRQQVRAFDADAIERLGIPGAVLMENAGRGFVEVLLGPLGIEPTAAAAIFCGTGNNGGDGFVIARHLVNHGRRAKIILCGDAAKLSGDAEINYNICCKMNIPIQQLDPSSADLPAVVKAASTGREVLIDALFGTGLKGELAEPFVALISCINAQHAPVIAVDIPSGLDCDTGLPLPVSIEAVATVTFVALKQGFLQTPDARNATGRVFVTSIGITPESGRRRADCV